MNLLFENLEKLIDAPNGIEKARELILQLAVQGKLVRQDPSDEPASELLKKIRKEKEKLIAEGKIKKQNGLSSIDIEEYPFKLPKGWLFERIGNIFFTTSGGTPSRGNFSYWNGDIPWLKSGELEDNMNISKTEEFITEEGLKNSSAKLFEKGSVVIALYGATAGKVGILGIDTTTNQAVCNFYRTSYVLNTYLFYFLKANRSKIIAECFGGAQPNISQDYVKKIIFSLPPLNEQKRIVEKVNSLMTLLAELEEKRERRNQKRIKLNNASLEKLLTSKDDKELKTNWKRIEENFSTLYSVPENVEKLKQAILQLAVQGKLVKQDPNDESASELLKKIKKEKEKLIAEGKIKKQKELPPIKDEEKPFDLSKGWEWVRLGEATNYGISLKAEGYELNDKTWVLELEDIEKITSRILQKVRFSDKKFKSTKNYFQKGDVIYAKLRPYLDKVIVADEDGVCTTEMIPIRGYSDIDPYYLRLVLKSSYFVEYATNSTHGMNLPRLGTDKARMALIPITSLKEQKRIVEKVNELMSLCNALEEKLTKKEAEAERLVGAVVNSIFNN